MGAERMTDQEYVWWMVADMMGLMRYKVEIKMMRMVLLGSRKLTVNSHLLAAKVLEKLLRKAMKQ